ncbi:MAG: KPN_02809 family neutral zinc metallopeptidase [Pseudoclavibacter sp.]
MTFNPNAKLDPSHVRRSPGARGTAIAGGGGLVVLLLVFVISQLTGIDPGTLESATGQYGGQIRTTDGSSAPIDDCLTGADANARDDCRMVGAASSISAYWKDEYPQLDVRGTYHDPDMQLFSGATSTGCGSATSSTGPFYCPADETIYIDTSFFQVLRSQYGASGGSLSQLYIVAHEWGHHIQQLGGLLTSQRTQDVGRTGGSVRTELQADCFAGSWVGAASTTRDENGQAYLEPPTSAQVADALNAAASVGDDHIQEQAQGHADPDSWTHGSSEMRQRWFTAGMQQGPQKCLQIFDVPDRQL